MNYTILAHWDIFAVISSSFNASIFLHLHNAIIPYDLWIYNKIPKYRVKLKSFGKHENTENIYCHILQKTVAMIEYTWCYQNGSGSPFAK